MTTDSAGNVVATIKYFPFGGTRLQTGDLDTDKKFTGQRLDDTGLYFYNARYYDATIGRFVSPDSIVPDPANPQTLNRYSYCLNNPLKYTDPSGHEVSDAVWARYVDTMQYWTYENDEWVWIGPNSPGYYGFEWNWADEAWDYLPFENEGYIPEAYTPRRVYCSVIPPFWTYPKREPESGFEKFVDENIWLLSFCVPEVPGTLGMAGKIGATGKIGEDALKMLGGESQVFFRTTRGARYVDQLVNGIANEAKVGRTSLTIDIQSQIAKDVELMATGKIEGSVWHFYRSPVTGGIGPTAPLENALREAGIDIVIHP